jgi:hypothetical protein
MHAHDELIRESEICFAVMGRDGQFTLFEVTAPGPLDEDSVSSAVAKGYGYCGVVGLTGGLVLTRHEDDADSWRTVTMSSRAVARLIAMRRAAEVASVDWCEALHTLSDPR